ncbi:hypothetical protein H4Q32_020355 [Labeo rohita]|uniref:Uncharacterized protein n=1 Tax=Labeo rohita TaxID=84645 RepID=A0ABQ8LFI3_LABRO|nr:hypothetical protein H4Q32_020355 [Labeo rohita]
MDVLNCDLSAEEVLLRFNSTCAHVLDLVAPLKTLYYKSRSEPWLDDSTHCLRQICRRFERKWKKDKLQVSLQMFRDSLFHQKAVKTAKSSNFTPITEKYLIDLVEHLKPTGSSIDVVPPYFLKQVLDVVGPHLLCLINHSLTVPNPNLGGLSSCVKQYVKNLGVVFDEHLRFDRQINSVVKTSFFQLRLLSKAKSFLSFKNFEKVIHAFITTRLDYCNSLYVGISQTALSRLQLVQNAAARLLAGVQKQDHITPVFGPYTGSLCVTE